MVTYYEYTDQYAHDYPAAPPNRIGADEEDR